MATAVAMVNKLLVYCQVNYWSINSKSEARNSKQYQNSNDQNSKHLFDGNDSFEH